MKITDIVNAIIAKVNLATNHIASITNPHNVTKGQVGLSDVDNTSDINKPVSTAQQTALNLKADIVDVDADLALKAPLDNPTFTGTVYGITKAMVNLANVNNTADIDKPISTLQQNALDLKADQSTTYTKTEVDTVISDLIGAAPSTLDTLNELSAALADDANFATTVSTNIGNVVTALDTHKLDTSNPHSVTKAQVGLGEVVNESKVTMFTDPVFTGTVSGIDKTMVGLANVNNTSDINKPVSTAQQAAVDGVIGTALAFAIALG